MRYGFQSWIVRPPTAELASVEECLEPDWRCNPDPSPPRGLPAWSGVSHGFSRKHRPTEASSVVAWRRRCLAFLVVNIARRGQAPSWREIAPAVLNLVPFAPARVVETPRSRNAGCPSPSSRLNLGVPLALPVLARSPALLPSSRPPPPSDPISADLGTGGASGTLRQPQP